MSSAYFFDVEIFDFDPADIARVKEAAGVAIEVSYDEAISPSDSGDTLSLTFVDDASSRYVEDSEPLELSVADEIADAIEAQTGRRPVVEVNAYWIGG